MTKRVIKIILIITVLAGLVYAGYFIRDMLLFAKGEIADTRRLELSKLDQILKTGDIIFQTSKSNQSKAIQIATGSKYSHMGIIYRQNNQLYVYEAIQPVKLTKLEDWVARGEDRKYVVKRLKNSEKILTPENLVKLKKVGERFNNKDYDIYFEWSDDKIYCSELVWKMYKEALNIEIGKLEKLKDFNLDDPIVKKKMRERYGESIPMDEIVISPESIFNSENIETIDTDYLKMKINK
jgi:hypothetical protein